mmetsp:Transcript_118950/g.384089  ORF Transcript_118950/g.384089 Transcript_118950/m.384089 type:complete len:263 (+) Transcript_118950:214-1002(+)
MARSPLLPVASRRRRARLQQGLRWTPPSKRTGPLTLAPKRMARRPEGCRLRPRVRTSSTRACRGMRRPLAPSAPPRHSPRSRRSAAPPRSLRSRPPLRATTAGCARRSPAYARRCRSCRAIFPRRWRPSTSGWSFTPSRATESSGRPWRSNVWRQRDSGADWERRSQRQASAPRTWSRRCGASTTSACRALTPSATCSRAWSAASRRRAQRSAAAWRRWTPRCSAGTLVWRTPRAAWLQPWRSTSKCWRGAWRAAPRVSQRS